MRPLSQALIELIGFAEETVTRPNRYSGGAFENRFGPLAAEISAADARPAEAERGTRAAMTMLYALEGFYAGDCPEGLMIAGATLPWLRREAERAFSNEKRIRA